METTVAGRQRVSALREFAESPLRDDARPPCTPWRHLRPGPAVKSRSMSEECSRAETNRRFYRLFYASGLKSLERAAIAGRAPRRAARAASCANQGSRDHGRESEAAGSSPRCLIGQEEMHEVFSYVGSLGSGSGACPLTFCRFSKE